MKQIYKPTIPSIIGYLLILGISIYFIIARWINVLSPDFMFLTKDMQSHISNFVISLLLYYQLGFLGLLYGRPFRYITFLGLSLIGANLICETMITFLNTPDIIDAVYGIIGTLVAFTFLYLTYRYGLIAIEEPNKE